MEQNTREWLLWRKQGIGGSDVPVVMGTSRFKTPFQLWEEKIDPEVKEDAPSFIQAKGHRLEPKARAVLELRTGREFSPALCQMADFPFMRCSLDGRTPEKDAIAEIKFQGEENHRLAALGRVPDEYMDQCQSNLMVSGAQLCYFVSINEKLADVGLESVYIVEVHPDMDRQAKILTECTKFWTAVTERKPVALTDRDFKTIKAKGGAALVRKWKSLKAKEKALKAEKDAVEEQIHKLAEDSGHPRVRLEGVNVMKIFRKGNVDYAKVPQLKGVDLEPYRKKGSSHWEIKEAKSE